MDVLYGEGETELWTTPSTPTRLRADRTALEDAATLLLQAKHPIIVVGDDVGLPMRSWRRRRSPSSWGHESSPIPSLVGRISPPTIRSTRASSCARSRPYAPSGQADLMFALGAEVFPSRSLQRSSRCQRI